MTVIIWDGKTLAADRMASDNYVKINASTKISRVRGHLVAAAGPAATSREMLAWFIAGAIPAEFPPSLRDLSNIDMLVITPQSEILLYQNTPYPIKMEGSVYALGCGKEAALAVVMLGYDALKAVEIASRICDGCGNGADALTLDEV